MRCCFRTARPPGVPNDSSTRSSSDADLAGSHWPEGQNVVGGETGGSSDRGRGEIHSGQHFRMRADEGPPLGLLFTFGCGLQIVAFQNVGHCLVADFVSDASSMPSAESQTRSTQDAVMALLPLFLFSRTSLKLSPLTPLLGASNRSNERSTPGTTWTWTIVVASPPKEPRTRIEKSGSPTFPRDAIQWRTLALVFSVAPGGLRVAGTPGDFQQNSQERPRA